MNKEAAVFSRDRWSALDRLIYLWRSAAIKRYLTGKQSVCDLGCGEEGYLLQTLRKTIPYCLGFDLKAKTRFNTPQFQLDTADLDKPLPLADQSVEAVISLAVIEHLNNYRQHVQEAWRILKPSGIFILTTPSPRAKPILETLAFCRLINTDSIRDHKRYFSKPQLLELFSNSGFKQTTFSHFQGGLNQLIIGRK